MTEKDIELIERGKSLIYPQRHRGWESFVERNSGQSLLEYTVKIMESLENGVPFEDIKKQLDDANFSGFAFTPIRTTLLIYSKKGVDFFNYYEPEVMNNPNNKEFIDKIVAENEAYSKGVTDFDYIPKTSVKFDVMPKNLSEQEMIDYLTQTASKYVHPAKLDRWVVKIAEAKGDSYRIGRYADALEVISVIRNGGRTEDAAKIIERKQHSNNEVSDIKKIVSGYAYTKEQEEEYQDVLDMFEDAKKVISDDLIEDWIKSVNAAYGDASYKANKYFSALDVLTVMQNGGSKREVKKVIEQQRINEREVEAFTEIINKYSQNLKAKQAAPGNE